MTFVYPLLLSGLVLIGIPVLLHLIMRQKPKHLLFPAVRFLMERQRTNQRKLQLRHLLLLALRILLVAAICLALSRPKIFSDRFNINADRPVAAVLVFDTSYSMGYTVAGATRLEEAKRRSLELLDEFPLGSQVAVLDSSESGGEWLTSVSLARERIAGLDLKPANFPATAQLTPAYDLLAKLPGEADGAEESPLRLLYVFSDRTTASWNSNQLENLERMRDRVPAPGARAVFVDVGVDLSADVALTALELPRAVIAANEKLVVRATVQATGTPCDTDITCTIDEQEPVDRKQVRLEPGHSVVMPFERRGLAPGYHQVRVSLAATDSLPFNNTRFATFEVQGPRKVLTLCDNPASADFWKLALEVGGSFDVDVKSAQDAWVRAMGPADLARYKAVCLLAVSKPSSDLWQKLESYVRNGGGLAVVPGGKELDRASYNLAEAQRVLPGSMTAIVAASEPLGAPWKEETYRHPVMAPFRDWRMSESVDFLKPGLEPRAFRYWEVDAPPNTVIVSYADKKERPALLESTFDGRSSRGRVLLFTMPLDRDHLGARQDLGSWSNYLKDSFYLVLVNKTVGYLAGDAEQRNFDYVSGQTVPIALPVTSRLPTYMLSGPDLTSANSVIPRMESQDQLEVTKAAMPGNYKVTGSDGSVVACFSVNIQPEESQLAQVPREQIERVFGPGAVLPIEHKASLRDALQSHWSQPIELLPWLMILVLLLMAAENLLANRFYRPQSPAAESAA
jgi:hypothetical protein